MKLDTLLTLARWSAMFQVRYPRKVGATPSQMSAAIREADATVGAPQDRDCRDRLRAVAPRKGLLRCEIDCRCHDTDQHQSRLGLKADGLAAGQDHQHDA